MLRIGKIGAAFGFALLLPVVASAQATISGVVKDASGAVLPGVTVEAASPALIEKVRTAVTDGTGQYAIENLRPGIILRQVHAARVSRPCSATASSCRAPSPRASMPTCASGGLEETIKVTGETPVVDVQSTRQERVLDREVLDALPNAGLRTALGVLIPSVDFRRQDVGGAGVQSGHRQHGGARRAVGRCRDDVERHVDCLVRNRRRDGDDLHEPDGDCRKSPSTPVRTTPSCTRAASAPITRCAKAATRSTASCSARMRRASCRATI